MKIAIVYNRESQNVINLFGTPNRERYGLKTIKRILDALKKAGHKAVAFEGDKDLIDNLESFMPRAMKGERPGLVFNLSYGIQGQARYTHVPGILEMVGVPYVGSGPLAHSLALDKVVAKMIFRQNGIPTPDFAVLDGPGFDAPDLDYPLIVKPKNEAVSFGLKIVKNEKELRAAADVIFEEFAQPALVEKYIKGKEINVGLIGNNPPEAFDPVEIVFGKGGPPIYTYSDKAKKSGREIKLICPARINKELAARAQELARKAFSALGCYDCARVDMRLDKSGNIYILEVNSLPSLGEGGSYVAAAAYKGMDYDKLVARLIEITSARYFGAPPPPSLEMEKDAPQKLVFNYLTGRRDQMERRAEEWARISSRTADPVGIQAAVGELEKFFGEMGMKPIKEFYDERAVWAWETQEGLENGTLLVGHLDTPVDSATPPQKFRKDPEWLYGEGIGASRAPLVMMEFALKSLRSHRLLRRVPLGVLFYTDEGYDCRYSSRVIKEAMSKAKQVLVLRPGGMGGSVVTQRRGQRKYRLIVEEKPRRPGHVSKHPEALLWVFSKMQLMSSMSSRKQRLSVSPVNVRVEAYPTLLPHKVISTVLISYPDKKAADAVEKEIKDSLGKDSLRWSFDLVSDRPPMKRKKASARLVKQMKEIAERWDIPFDHESSTLPSVAGLAPAGVPVLCGVGPVARDVYMGQEAAQRISLIQRTLLLAEFLADQIADGKKYGKKG